MVRHGKEWSNIWYGWSSVLYGIARSRMLYGMAGRSVLYGIARSRVLYSMIWLEVKVPCGMAGGRVLYGMAGG
jgi:hypothetical protein